ncbi:hypothetical protein FDP41_012133 [Naegleria fowleri]|uniref:Uncharacterized protein n=1 Tax=Naegleria fowleri TaxID=5763 RepID=A0A6A5C1E2_NAEFO|nr:uncharacterized protein FDP41_012133 [Naegleria fowleri]KAF0981476.1 hypothetical protein FDP41_012133 [Naegleria fowleri]
MNEWNLSHSHHRVEETHMSSDHDISQPRRAMTKSLEFSHNSSTNNNENNYMSDNNNNNPNDGGNIDEDETGRVIERSSTYYSKIFSWIYIYFGKFSKSPPDLKAWILRAAKLFAVFLFSQLISALLTSTGIFSTFLTDRVHVNLPTLQNALSYLTLLIFYMPLLLVHKVCYPSVTRKEKKYRKMRRKSFLHTSRENSKELMTSNGHVTLHESSPNANILNENIPHNSPSEMSQKKLTEQSRLLSPASSFSQLDSMNSSIQQNHVPSSSSAYLEMEHSELQPSFSQIIPSDLNPTSTTTTSHGSITRQQVHNISHKASPPLKVSLLEEHPIQCKDNEEDEFHQCLFKYVKRCLTFRRWNMKPWKYFFFALADVEANFFVVKAYQYTTITSVMLLDCFTIPCVMILSALFLNRSYRWTHIVGVLICLGGLALLVLSDYLNHVQQGEKNDRPWYYVLIGDAFCIIGSACYAISNVAQEYAVKTEEHFTELVQKEDEEEHLEETSSSSLTQQPLMESTISTVIHQHENSTMNDAEPQQELQQRHHVNKMTIIPSHDQENVNQNQTSKKPSNVKKIKLTENDCVIEYLAMMGLFGTLIATIQLLVFELQDIRNTEWNSRSIFFMGGFAASMFLIYTLVPHLLRWSSATFMNLSFLTSDIFAVISSIFLFGQSINFLYYIAYVIIALGLVFYNILQEGERKTKSLTSRLKALFLKFLAKMRR